MKIKEILKQENIYLENGKPILWFWEADSPAIIMGTSGKENVEANINICRNDGIEIHKRRSGGGTVVVGKGVLCFGVVMKKGWNKVSPSSLAKKILTPISNALSTSEFTITIKGMGDLTYGNYKICGTAQRWLKTSVMLHGSILVDFDLILIDKYLKHPPLEPDYRKGRRHKDFCKNLSEINTSITTVTAASKLIADAFDLPTIWLNESLL